MSGPSYKLKQALDGAVGELDTECDVIAAMPTEDEAIFVIRAYVEDGPIRKSRMKRIHNRFMRIVAEEFGIDDDYETFEVGGDEIDEF